MPGVPRATYLPLPFQIVQSSSDILFVYEFATTNRLVNMGKPQEAGADSWMGTSNGHWEGKTLVVDVTGLNGLAWLDRAGDYASSNLHVVERYTLVDRDHIDYEATLEDAKVLTGHGKSECLCIDAWKPAPNSWISNVSRFPKNYFTGNIRRRATRGELR